MSQASPDCRPQGFIFANANDPPEAITRRIEGLNSHSAEFFGQASKSRRLSSGMRGPLSNANGFPRRLEDNLLLASPCAPGKIRAQWRDGMSAPARTHDRRYTIEEFEAMDFGGLPAELIDGLVTVAHALDHGPPHEDDPGPDLTVRCRDEDGTRHVSVVVEVLSPPNTANEMADKLRACKAVLAVMDILSLSQDKYYAVHHRRRDRQWQAGADLAGPEAEIVIGRWNARIRLCRVYDQVLD
jgi:hypothetical protein